jgi:hypothetical protein
MPFLLALLPVIGRFVATGLGYWLVSAMIAIGVGFAADSFAVQPMLEQIQSYMSGVPGDTIAWVRFLNVDRYITGILSCYAAAAATSALKMRKR